MLIMHDQSVCVFTLMEFQAFVFTPTPWLTWIRFMQISLTRVPIHHLTRTMKRKFFQ